MELIIMLLGIVFGLIISVVALFLAFPILIHFMDKYCDWVDKKLNK